MIQLSNPVNATLGQSQATVTISADGPPGGGGPPGDGGGGGPLPGTPTIEFDAKDYTVVEGTLPSGQYTKAILTVKLSAAATTDVTVNYDFNGGTATVVADWADRKLALTRGWGWVPIRRVPLRVPPPEIPPWTAALRR